MINKRPLIESLNSVEKKKVDIWKLKMSDADTRLGVLYCEWRAHLVLNKAVRRINKVKSISKAA